MFLNSELLGNDDPMLPEPQMSVKWHSKKCQDAVEIFPVLAKKGVFLDVFLTINNDQRFLTTDYSASPCKELANMGDSFATSFGHIFCSAKNRAFRGFRPVPGPHGHL
jgi:hypothetical protein